MVKGLRIMRSVRLTAVIPVDQYAEDTPSAAREWEYEGRDMTDKLEWVVEMLRDAEFHVDKWNGGMNQTDGDFSETIEIVDIPEA